MVAVDPRAAVTRPCAGRALPWNASFMTIPFELGIFAEAPFGSSCSSNRPPSAFWPRGSPSRAPSQAVYVVGLVRISVRPARRWPAVVLSLGYRTAYYRRISAGYFTGGYPPVDRMP